VVCDTGGGEIHLVQQDGDRGVKPLLLCPSELRQVRGYWSGSLMRIVELNDAPSKVPNMTWMHRTISNPLLSSRLALDVALLSSLPMYFNINLLQAYI
jgi:hypothetical protein